MKPTFCNRVMRRMGKGGIHSVIPELGQSKRKQKKKRDRSHYEMSQGEEESTGCFSISLRIMRFTAVLAQHKCKYILFPLELIVIKQYLLYRRVMKALHEHFINRISS